jgi:hypothetical protein
MYDLEVTYTAVLLAPGANLKPSPELVAARLIAALDSPKAYGDDFEELEVLALLDLLSQPEE